MERSLLGITNRSYIILTYISNVYVTNYDKVNYMYVLYN